LDIERMRTFVSQSCVIRAVRFEALEPRQLRAGDLPGAGEDLHLLLGDDGSVVAKVAPEQNRRQSLTSFKWYDGTPDGHLSQLSDQLEEARVDNYYIWPNTPGLGTFPGATANEAGVRQLAREVADSGQDLVVIDNETWHFDIRFYSRAVVDKTIADMKEMIGWIREERPQLKIGVYGYMSQSDDHASLVWQLGSEEAAAGDQWYQGNMQHFAESFADWQATSDYLRPLAESVDYMFPVLYTGTTDMDLWERSAKSTIEDSRRYGKPVIPFLWPYYHEAIGQGLGLTEIPTADWQRELNLVREYGDGAFIWTHDPVVGDEAWVGALLSTAAPQVGSQSFSESSVLPPLLLSSMQTDGGSPFTDLPIDGATEDEFFLSV
jgi:hypothetical protein